jgi:hypothetical protein
VDGTLRVVALVVVGFAVPALAVTQTVTSFADDGSSGTLRHYESAIRTPW